jgi:iron complex outermembrane recepter protein
MERSFQRLGTGPQCITNFRRTQVALAVGLALFTAQVSAAQQNQPAADEDIEQLEEVTVTGSRIRSVTGMDTPTPVAAITAEELEAMSPTSLTSALVQMPQFANSTTAENFGPGFFVSPGGGSLNLRGIGSKRTLTLLDGRRMVPASANGGPDINMFPVQMLKRIEAVTGGASAAYGTDAVSGVVNFILDTDFEGLHFTAQNGFSDRSDAGNQMYSMELGHKVGDRAHLLFSAGYSQQDDVLGYAGRDWYQGCGLIANPSVPTGVTAGISPEVPVNVPACNLHSTASTYDGLFTIGTGAAARTYELQPDGSAILFNRTVPGSMQPGGGGQNLAMADTQLLPAQNRKNVFAYADYDVNDNLNVFAQGMASWQTLRQIARVGDFLAGPPQQLTIFRNNAFLPSSVATIMDAAGVGSLVMTRNGHPEDWGRGSFANISRTQSATVGFKSTIASEGYFNGWSVDGNLQYGRNKLDAAQEGGIRLDRVYLATDAVLDTTTNTIRCNVTRVSGNAPDCVPLNVFGRGNASPEAVDWIKGYDPGEAVTVSPFIGFDTSGQPTYGEPWSYTSDAAKHRLITTTQKLAEITASGNLFEGWAGPISAAVGAHWRKESIDQKVKASAEGNTAADPTYRPVWCNDGNTDARCVAQIARGIRPPGTIGVRGVGANSWQNIVDIQFSNVPFIAGSFDVKELFTETMVPLISGQSWMQDLNLLGSVRWADYAGSGNIWSYKVGLNATITDEWRLRGTFSRDTRAANIAERFDRTGGFTAPLNDFISPLPTGWTNPTAVTTVQGGDPNVAPEEADTYTVGLVYRPEWLPNFSASVDWLQVSLKGAIEQLPAQRVLDLCAAGDADQCARISRDPTTNMILFVPQTFQNLSKVYLEAVDVEFGYSHAVNWFGGNERLGVRLFGTYLIENSTTNSQGVKTESTGDSAQQLFERKANLSLNYSNGAFSGNLQARYIAGGKLSSLYNLYSPTLDRVNYNVADNSIGSVFYWDTRIGYELPVAGGNLELFANVNNLLDRDPPLVLGLNSSAQIGGGFNTLGRTFVLGVNMKF